MPEAKGLNAPYTPEDMERIMDTHHYHLQYKLYLLGLCRSLWASRRRAVNWNEEIGGAFYLFVRGMRPSDQRGIYFARPSREEIMALAESAGLERVIV